MNDTDFRKKLYNNPERDFSPAMTFGDIVVLAVLGLIIGSVIRKMVKDKKSGKSCGCGSCQGCSMAGSCHGASCSCGGLEAKE